MHLWTAILLWNLDYFFKCHAACVSHFWISWCCKYSTFRWVSFLSLLVCIAVDPWINRFIRWIYCLLLISTFHWGTNMTNVYLKNQSPADFISKCCCCEANLIIPVSVRTGWRSYLLFGPDRATMGCQPKSMKVDETVSCLVTYTDWKLCCF